MYLNLEATAVREKTIIGIFDLDTTTVSRHTRHFLNAAAKKGQVIASQSYVLPKSFLLCTRAREQVLYISQFAPSVLQKRLEQVRLGEESKK